MFAIPRDYPFPFPFPENSFWGGGGSITPVTIFPPKKRTNGDPTHTVTEIRGHCSEGGKGWGLISSLFSKQKNAHFGDTCISKKIVFF